MSIDKILINSSQTLVNLTSTKPHVTTKMGRREYLTTVVKPEADFEIKLKFSGPNAFYLVVDKAHHRALQKDYNFVGALNS